MKRPTLAGALPILLMAVVVSAQVPTKMSYQGVLTDGSGAPVADGSHSLVFKLYNVSTGGAALWTETQGSVNTTNGVLSVVLGSVMPIGIVFDGALWLGIAVDGGGELTPRIELTTSPYAFTASDVDDDAVTSAKIADGAVTTADIADGTVASADIADGTVAAADILDGTITAADVAAAQVVKSVNTLTDAVTLTAGTNMTITPAGNVLTFDATVAGGNTLDMAYDQGGAGAGRTITADNGAVDITGTDGLQVTNSSVLFTGTTGTIPATGAGTRLMWYPAKDAFRAGVVAGTQWDDANIGDESTVTGGSDNIASGQRSVVSGGVTNTASGITSTIGGGQGNTATALNATVAGGTFNDATQSQTAIGGGTGNTASAVGSTVSGGSTNTASGNTATVGGGATNTASGQDAVVAGGSNNMATATRSMIPGGYLNTAAGLYSFAAGRRAKANHAGAFVWGDQTDADFVSTAADQFLIRAGGGVGIGTASPSGVLHVLETVAQPAKAYIESPSGNGSQLIVKVGDATSVSHLYFGDTGADNSGQVTYNHTSNSMHFSTNATQVATIDNAGNVGIGTTSPSNRLHVDLTGSNEVRIDKNVDWVGSGFTQLRLSDVTTPNKMLRIGYSAVGDFAVLQSQEAGVVVKPLTLNPNGGNVGIGTTSPDVRLDIVGDPNGAVRISDTDADVTSKNLSIVGTQNTNADGLWRVIGGSANGTANIADIGWRLGRLRCGVLNQVLYCAGDQYGGNRKDADRRQWQCRHRHDEFVWHWW